MCSNVQNVPHYHQGPSSIIGIEAAAEGRNLTCSLYLMEQMVQILAAAAAAGLSGGPHGARAQEGTTVQHRSAWLRAHPTVSQAAAGVLDARCPARPESFGKGAWPEKVGTDVARCKTKARNARCGSARVQSTTLLQTLLRTWPQIAASSGLALLTL